MEMAIISASVALIIFTFSQILIHLRDRQTFLRQKLEELFDSLNDVSDKLIETYYGAQNFEKTGKNEDLKKQMIAINKALYKPRTLFLLYFPYLIAVWEKAFVSPFRAYVAYANKADQKKGNFTADECRKHIEELSLKIRFIQNFLADNVAFSTKSIGFHLKRICTGKTKVKIKT